MFSCQQNPQTYLGIHPLTIHCTPHNSESLLCYNKGLFLCCTTYACHCWAAFQFYSATCPMSTASDQSIQITQSATQPNRVRLLITLSIMKNMKHLLLLKPPSYDNGCPLLGLFLLSTGQWIYGASSKPIWPLYSSINLRCAHRQQRSPSATMNPD